MPKWPEELVFAVEAWSADGNTIEEVLARASHILVARAAYDEAAKHRPRAWLRLRIGIRVIEERQPQAQ